MGLDRHSPIRDAAPCSMLAPSAFRFSVNALCGRDRVRVCGHYLHKRPSTYRKIHVTCPPARRSEPHSPTQLQPNSNPIRPQAQPNPTLVDAGIWYNDIVIRGAIWPTADAAGSATNGGGRLSVSCCSQVHGGPVLGAGLTNAETPQTPSWLSWTRSTTS